MSTIREHLEWIAAGHVDGNPLGWIVAATERAVEALETLDKADVGWRAVPAKPHQVMTGTPDLGDLWDTPRLRLIPDPKPEA